MKQKRMLLVAAAGVALGAVYVLSGTSFAQLPAERAPAPTDSVLPRAPAALSQPGGPTVLFGGLTAPQMTEADRLTHEEMTAQYEASVAAKAYVQASEAGDLKAADEAKSKLTDALKKQFDAQQSRRRLEIDQLKKRLDKINQLVAKRESIKDDLIRRRVEDLINEEMGLGWNDSQRVDPNTGLFSPFGGVDFAPNALGPVTVPAGNATAEPIFTNPN